MSRAKGTPPVRISPGGGAIRGGPRLRRPRPGVQLDFLVVWFDPSFRICCTDQQYLHEMLDLIVTQAGDSDPAAAVARSLMLSERAVASGKATSTHMPTVKLKLVRAEKALGCEVRDDQIGTWLSGIANYA